MKFGIIGTGLIGKKRAQALQDLKHTVVCAYDWDRKSALEFSNQFKTEVTSSFEELIKKDIEAVIIAVPPKYSYPYCLQAIQNKKNVLVEKPVVRNVEEIKVLLKASLECKVFVKVGFNHRFHGALLKTKELLSKNTIGKILYIRARYGHGGRPGYETEWRANPDIGGGGELIDQGIHLLDLNHFLFEKKFELMHSFSKTLYWNMPVEDNALLWLKSDSLYVFLHASCTEWKNLFDYEIFGSDGKIQILGLGGSYGEEQLKIFIRNPKGGAPLESTEIFTQDFSWNLETQAFIESLQSQNSFIGSLEDAKHCMELIDQVYKLNHRTY